MEMAVTDISDENISVFLRNGQHNLALQNIKHAISTTEPKSLLYVELVLLASQVLQSRYLIQESINCMMAIYLTLPPPYLSTDGILIVARLQEQTGEAEVTRKFSNFWWKKWSQTLKNNRNIRSNGLYHLENRPGQEEWVAFGHRAFDHKDFTLAADAYLQAWTLATSSLSADNSQFSLLTKYRFLVSRLNMFYNPNQYGSLNRNTQSLAWSLIYNSYDTDNSFLKEERCYCTPHYYNWRKVYKEHFPSIYRAAFKHEDTCASAIGHWYRRRKVIDHEDKFMCEQSMSIDSFKKKNETIRQKKKKGKYLIQCSHNILSMKQALPWIPAGPLHSKKRKPIKLSAFAEGSLGPPETSDEVLLNSVLSDPSNLPQASIKEIGPRTLLDLYDRYSPSKRSGEICDTPEYGRASSLVDDTSGDADLWNFARFVSYRSQVILKNQLDLHLLNEETATPTWLANFAQILATIRKNAEPKIHNRNSTQDTQHSSQPLFWSNIHARIMKELKTIFSLYTQNHGSTNFTRELRLVIHDISVYNFPSIHDLINALERIKNLGVYEESKRNLEFYHTQHTRVGITGTEK